MSKGEDFLITVDAGSPIVATAIHNGRDIRPEVARLLSLSEAERLREEDPFTGGFARVAPTWVIGECSRFEIDLNRPREQAIYRLPEQAWGLDVWRETPSDDAFERSLAKHDEFYETIASMLRELADKQGRVVVLDLHSYNHRRQGPEAALDDPAANPDVNIGTGSMDRRYWGGLVDHFIADLRACPYQGGHLDVRENVKFQGGHLCKWIHQMFPGTVCAIAVEFKKFFMDEWTGEPDQERIEANAAALRSTFPGLIDSLGTMNQAVAAAHSGHSS